MQKKRLLLAGKRIMIFHLLAGLMMVGSLYMYWSNAAVTVVSMPVSENTFLGITSWREVLSQGIPGLAQSGRTHAAQGAKSPFTIYGMLYDALDFFTNIDSRDLRSILRAELPVLALVPVNSTRPNPSDVPDAPKFTPARSIPSGKPIVGVYHTHTAESFIPSTGVAHRPGGQIGEICEVGSALVKSLEQNGIPAIQDVTINDYPSFMKAYGASEVTLQRMLKENPSLQMVFDLHRDAEKRDNVVGTINGETVAKISIIVAQGQKDLPQPNWRENYAMAKLIDRKCNERYPGLLRGIQLVEWRYNQHLHPHALILEVGSHETSTEEAIRAVELLSEVLADILKEEN